MTSFHWSSANPLSNTLRVATALSLHWRLSMESDQCTTIRIVSTVVRQINNIRNMKRGLECTLRITPYEIRDLDTNPYTIGCNTKDSSLMTNDQIKLNLAWFVWFSSTSVSTYGQFDDGCRERIPVSSKTEEDTTKMVYNWREGRTSICSIYVDYLSITIYQTYIAL